MKSSMLAAVAAFAALRAAAAFAQVSTQTGWTLTDRVPPFAESVPVCVYVDRSKRWASAFEVPEGTPCVTIRAIPKQRLLAFVVPGFSRRGMLAGAADGACTDSLPAYSVCTSRFFQRLPGRHQTDYVVLNAPMLDKALLDANIVGLLEERERSEAAAKLAADQQRYRDEIAAADTLTTIRAVRSRYASNDPEGLLPSLDARVTALKMRAFQEATDALRLRSFITEYGREDSGELIDQARSRLAKLEAQASKAKELADAERAIARCKQMIVTANKAIAREKQIAAVSGYENKLVLRQAGEYIVSCQTALPRSYAKYKQLGGSKPYAAIN